MTEQNSLIMNEILNLDLEKNIPIKNSAEDDPLFQEDTRNAALPILYPTIHELTKKMRGCFWQTHEVSLAQDIIDWKTLNTSEQHYIKMVLAFFASSDLSVNNTDFGSLGAINQIDFKTSSFTSNFF